MIKFEEELKNFKPIPEVSQAEEDILSSDIRDVSDLVRESVAKATGNTDDKK